MVGPRLSSNKIYFDTIGNEFRLPPRTHHSPLMGGGTLTYALEISLFVFFFVFVSGVRAIDVLG